MSAIDLIDVKYLCIMHQRKWKILLNILKYGKKQVTATVLQKPFFNEISVWLGLQHTFKLQNKVFSKMSFLFFCISFKIDRTFSFISTLVIFSFVSM